MKKIKLTQNKYALVDNEDFDKINEKKWFFDGKYARRIEYKKYKNGWKVLKRVRMHRQILGFPQSMIDHKNGNGLDNRRENLRLCTRSQNSSNKIIQSNNISGYKGVSWWNTRKIWKATIKINGKAKHLLYSKNPKEAARAYNEAAKIYYQEFAKLNKI